MDRFAVVAKQFIRLVPWPDWTQRGGLGGVYDPRLRIERGLGWGLAQPARPQLSGSGVVTGSVAQVATPHKPLLRPALKPLPWRTCPLRFWTTFQERWLGERCQCCCTRLLQARRDSRLAC